MSSTKNEAIGIKSNAVVVFDKNELSTAEAVASEPIRPNGVDGNIEVILEAITLCKSVFSVAIASKNPPKNKNMVDFE